MRTQPKAARRAALLIAGCLLGSQASGLAPVAFSAPAPTPPRGALKAVRLPAGAPSSPEARAVAIRRAELARALPHRLGPVRRGPWVSGARAGRLPLLAPSLATGALERTRAFTGTPETLRVLGLRIDFATDRLGSQTTTPDGRFDMRDGKALGMVIDPPPHDRNYFLSHLAALSRYWRFTSYGNLVITYDVYPKGDSAAYRLGDTGDYGPWTLGQASYDEAQRFFKDAVTMADQTDSIPFGDFDAVALFHAGSDFQTDIAGDSPRDFPTFEIGLTDSVPVNGGAVTIFGGLVMPETENQDGYLSALNGTLAHEYGHVLGLPDLYDINTFFPAVGVWSNMDSGYLLSTLVTDSKTGAVVEATGILPTSLDPWCKTQLWPDRLDLLDPGRSTSTTLRATELNDRLLYLPLGGDEYYLVENREADLNGDNTIYLDRDSTTSVLLGPGLSSDDPSDSLGDKEYDFLLPGQGILVWHVDDTVIFGPNIPPDYGINSNPDRRGVAVVEADGIEDIGDPNSRYFFGSPFDPYFVGNRTRLAPDTSPSTASNDGGQSHLAITVKSPSGPNMDLDVLSEWRALGWPVFTDFGLPAAPPTYGSLLHDGRRNVVGSSDSLVYAWTSQGEPYYTANGDGRFATLPAPIHGAVLFADSLFHRNPAAPHGAAVVATGEDGQVYAVRPASRDSLDSAALFGWPPSLGAGITATTAPVLSPLALGGVVVGANDGRIFEISPSDSVAVAPIVASICDSLLSGSVPIASRVIGNLAVGRFTGAGGYMVAYALENGDIRLVSQAAKGSGVVDRHWQVGGFNFDPYILGVDVDRASDRDLEIVVVDRPQGTVHCFDLNGNELPGWPVQLATTIPGAAAAGDLDGDGYPEIFAVDNEGNAHRWNRNGIEPKGWPVALWKRYGAAATATTGSPVVGDLDGRGGSELLVGLANGVLVALGNDGKAIAGYPIASQAGPGLSPLLLSLDDTGNPPDPPGPAWLHVVVGGGDGLWNGFQVDARADSALFTTDGTSPRTPWIGYGGNRRRSSVLDDPYLAPAAPPATALARGSLYCYPNPARGNDIGIAYTLGEGVGSVDIRVLDPLGNEVRRVQGSTSATQNVARIPVQDLASGVYIVRLEVKRGGASQVAFQKFAVVR
ncbi:MAG TPA: FG-GAP-like repeat-containing protein [Candidatus Eisenbacteria bacterium]